MTQFNTTIHHTKRRVNKVISKEAKKRCQILRNIEFRNELKALGLSPEEVEESFNLTSVTPKQG
ncbi:hypothetical protein FM037_03175 [Shewanella psychropiezotolerans]|uniref:DUF1127 domain-containing protein n=1 Tax=Shewanella psychropiezotolerans TaxID=2593655 RepID=A0ABX5WU57_9GAMM|nr:hypothetical protein [Shewanella psychropiezotolerans]QDO82428.1 hypothetical protein FM037_03175 [Shewanella psychropiezotolerans]